MEGWRRVSPVSVVARKIPFMFCVSPSPPGGVLCAPPHGCFYPSARVCIVLLLRCALGDRGVETALDVLLIVFDG